MELPQATTVRSGSGDRKKVRTTVGSKYGAGEGGGIVWGAYAGEVGSLINWNGDVIRICGENGGLDCGGVKEGVC